MTVNEDIAASLEVQDTAERQFHCGLEYIVKWFRQLTLHSAACTFPRPIHLTPKLCQHRKRNY